MNLKLYWFATICILPVELLSAQPTVRLPVPADAAVKGSTGLIAEIYRKDYDAAKSPAQKQALCKKLLEDGQKSSDDPTAKFALFQVARKIAIGIGDVDSALLAIEQSAAAFDFNPGEDKRRVFEELASTIKSPEDTYTLTRYIGRELNSRIKANDLAVAESLIAAGISAAKKSKDAELLKQWTRRQSSLDSRVAAWAAAEPASKYYRPTLGTQRPTSRRGNTTVSIRMTGSGGYQCSHLVMISL